MSDAHPSAAELRIDRLVLDIPGLDAAQGRALALGIAQGLADAGVKADAMAGAQREHGMVAVRLAAAVGAPSDLAARIVAALLERLA